MSHTHDARRGEQLVTRIALTADMTVERISTHKTTLLAAISRSKCLELDLSEVTKIDTAGVQLLILLKREAQEQGKQVVFYAHSAAVREAIDFCNLAAAFGDPMVIPA